MKRASLEMIRESKRIEKGLATVASQYLARNDARWLFAFAHHGITTQINASVTRDGLYRDPDHLLRFNVYFATAFINAVNGMVTLPWKQAFATCVAVRQKASGPSGLGNMLAEQIAGGNAVKICATAMANAHINTDIVNALKIVGCIDRFDYGNILLFVEGSSREAIIRLQGETLGPVYGWLKEMLSPLDKIWRNAVYVEVCKATVPPIEPSFRRAIAALGAGHFHLQPSMN